MTDRRPDVSVLIVNWRSGAWVRALAANLRQQRFIGRDGGPGTLELIVTDNASGPADEAHLAALERDGVTVVRSRQNAGYGLGMNMAAAHATGDFVLVTNPDVMAFPGALAALLEHVQRTPACGLAGPRGYLDPECFFLLPPVDMPGLLDLAMEGFARNLRACGRRHAAARTRRALESWTATAPRPVSMISGFCFLMPAPLAKEFGPFDPSFPFYYEDADLCRRVHRAGFTTDLVPRARMVHFFNRSASQAQDAAWSRYAVSRRLFFRRRYGPLGRLAYDAIAGLTRLGGGKGHLFAPVEDLGTIESEPTIEVPRAGAYVVEIAADPGFLFAAGRLDVTRRFTIPDAVWQGLDPARYYVRFLDRRSLDVVHVVSIRRTVPARSPLEHAPAAAPVLAAAGA